MQTLAVDNFHLMVLDESDDDSTKARINNYGYRHFEPNKSIILKKREKVLKAAQYLGPWCHRCGKKGKDCRTKETCRIRQMGKFSPWSAKRQLSAYTTEMGL